MRIRFAFPFSSLPLWLLVAGAGLAVVIFTLRALDRRRRDRLNRFVEAGLAPRLLGGYDDRIRRPLNLFTILGFTCLALAFFQPHWGQAWQDIRRSGRDILIVLDTSESMKAPNPLPSRMERAKQEISGLLDLAPGDRFGLVAFSGAAALQCPLTLDQGYFRAVLNAVDTNTISREGTDIASALREARKVFEEQEERTGEMARSSQAVLLISDGEDVSGDALEAAEELSKYARIFVIGVGNPEGTVVGVPEWMAPYRSSMKENQTHVSKLDEESLMRIAATGNGAYVRSGVDSWEIDEIYKRFRALSAREVAGDVRMQMVNRYQWPLAAAVLSFILEGIWLFLMPYLRRWRTGRKPTSEAGEYA